MRPSDRYLRTLRRTLRTLPNRAVIDVDPDVMVAALDELLERRQRDVAN